MTYYIGRSGGSIRIPKEVLSHLTYQAQDETYVFHRLYRNLYNELFYIDLGKSLHTPLNRQMIVELIEQFKTQKYEFISQRDKYSDRTLASIVYIQDELVCGVIYQLLACVFPKALSHYKDKVKALKQVCHTFHAARWILKGKMIVDWQDVDDRLLIGILRNRIQDERFIQLMWKIIRSIYMSPSHIIREKRSRSQFEKLKFLLQSIYLYGINQSLNQKFLQPEMNSIQYAKRPMHVWYHHTFIIGITGSKPEALYKEKKIMQFLSQQFKLKKDNIQTQVFCYTQLIPLFNHEIRFSRKNKNTLRSSSHHIELYLPHKKCMQDLLRFKVLQITANNRWKTVHRSDLIHLQDIDILRTYNRMIQQYYITYQLIKNKQTLHLFRRIMKSSMLKTFASKYKSTVRQIVRKYNMNGRFCVLDPYKKKSKKICFFKIKELKKMK